MSSENRAENNYSLSFLLSLTLAMLSANALANSFSTVDEETVINVPAVQVGADFYQVELVPIEENWQVAIAESIDRPQFISARVIEDSLT